MKLTMVEEKSSLKYPNICNGAFFVFNSGRRRNVILHLKLADGFCEVGEDRGNVYAVEGATLFDGDSITHVIVDEIIAHEAADND